MKLILYLLLVFAFVLPGCSPSSDTTPVTEAPAASAPAEPEGPIPAGQVPASYIDAADALFNGDFDRAKGSLAAMAAETTGELQTRTQAAAAAPDLATMRQEFKKVSDIAARMELPPDHAAASCPMYVAGSRSLWVQKRGTLANPYYGKTDAMASCGSFLN